MKIPLSWISLYSPLSPILQKYAIKDLAHEYSIHTAEIDGIEEYRIDKIVIGKVITYEKHPESTKLSICEVSIGTDETTTILTGAPNISQATYVPVALIGAKLAPDFIISDRKMAGMTSRGMICGADEIGLSKETSTGIMILEEHWEPSYLESRIGSSVYDLTLPFPGHDGGAYEYPLGDIVFEIDNKFITNRPDLFSVIGNAREFHAVFDTDLIPYVPKNIDNQTQELKVEILTDKVLSYHLMQMDHLTIGQSPFSLALMMERAGLPVKMDIVDITNLIMTELGQPMHAFDAEKIVGHISVRQARAGEKLLALNGVEYTLTDEDMIIADEQGPLALAGIIGGMTSAVSPSTRSVIWESACFDPTSVRLSAQRHGIRTDASTRYEKSLDPLLAHNTFSRVQEYLTFLNKSYTVTGTSNYLDSSRLKHITLDITYERIEKKIGIHISPSQIQSILTKLGFQYTPTQYPSGEGLSITVPSWRATKDISIPEDIIEEIARVVGYDQVPYTPLDASFTIGKKNPDIDLKNLTYEHLKNHGWHEVYNYGFTSEKLDQKAGYSSMEGAIHIRNAFNEEYTHMVRSLAPRLFLDISHNQKYSKTFAFFEYANVYHLSGVRNNAEAQLLESIEQHPFPEKKMLAGVALDMSMDTFRLTIESYLKSVLGYIPPVHQECSLPFLHPNVSGTYRDGDTIIARFGRIHPEVAHAFDISESVLYMEVEIVTLCALSREKDLRFNEISRYQTIPRELNFVMDSHIPTGDVARVLDAIHPWIHDISVDSVYRDDIRLGAGKKSVNFAFTLSNMDGTISDEEALSVQNLIIDTMHSHGYILRN